MFNPHEYLNSFTNFEANLQQLTPTDFSLSRIKELLDALGNPEKKLKFIHVAGTKGKGSTCVFIAGILQHSGYKVGLFTSPHLHKVNERIRLVDLHNKDSKELFPGCISDDNLASILTGMRPHVAKIINKGSVLTYFEVLTVAAIDYFAKCQVDFVVLETGLGGRLDATNAVDAIITVLTPISMDHVNILGPTLTHIAAEKAGIVKHSYQEVVVAPQEKEAMDVIINRCREFGIAPLMVVPEKYKDLKIALRGAHQTVNAATALNVIEVLKKHGVKISEEAITDGLKHVRWSGRFEVIRENPLVVVDCAHNAASAKALAQALNDVYPYRRVIMVLGVSADKDVAKICSHLKENAAHVILTKADHPRAHTFTDKEAKQYFGSKPYTLIPDVPSALKEALRLTKTEDMIVVTGSIFIVAQAMKEITRYVSI